VDLLPSTLLSVKTVIPVSAEFGAGQPVSADRAVPVGLSQLPHGQPHGALLDAGSVDHIETCRPLHGNRGGSRQHRQGAPLEGRLATPSRWGRRLVSLAISGPPKLPPYSEQCGRVSARGDLCPPLLHQHPQTFWPFSHGRLGCFSLSPAVPVVPVMRGTAQRPAHS